MVTDGSRVWVEIQDSSLFTTPVPADLTATLFVNEETYLVLANYGRSSLEINSLWTWRDRESGWTGQTLAVPPGTLRYLVADEESVTPVITRSCDSLRRI